MCSILIFFLSVSSTSSASSLPRFDDVGDVLTWWFDEGVVCFVDGEHGLEVESSGYADDNEDVDSIFVSDLFKESISLCSAADVPTSTDTSTASAISMFSQ